MEDIFKFLFVIGIIAIGFVRQARKEAKTSTGNGPAMPMPDAESPFPENWDEASVGSGDILSVFGQTGGCLGADLCFFAAFFRGALTSGPGFSGLYPL